MFNRKIGQNGIVMTDESIGSNETHGLVCAHHHLYSTLARGMPAPASQPDNFEEILKMEIGRASCRERV